MWLLAWLNAIVIICFSVIFSMYFSCCGVLASIKAFFQFNDLRLYQTGLVTVCDGVTQLIADLEDFPQFFGHFLDEQAFRHPPFAGECAIFSLPSARFQQRIEGLLGSEPGSP